MPLGLTGAIGTAKRGEGEERSKGCLSLFFFFSSSPGRLLFLFPAVVWPLEMR